MSNGPVFQNDIRGGGNLYQGTINIQQHHPVPLDLFRDPPYWTNHMDRLEFIMEWMTLADPDPLVIKGPKYTGKSALIGVAACRRRDHLPHGVLHLEPRRHGVHAELTTALERLGAGRISSLPGAAEKHYRSLLADLRLLVVIDEPRNKGEIEAFWPEGARGLCIVLTTKDLHWTEAHQMEMPPLSTEDAIDLLERAKRLPAEVNRELVAAFGGYPGNLLRAAGVVAAGDISVAKLVDLAGTHADRALFLKAFDQISASAKRLYRALCALPDPVFERAMLDWLDRSVPDGDRPVQELEEHQLIYEVGPAMWRVQHRPEGADVGGPND
jgi:hypothetical protein